MAAVAAALFMDPPLPRAAPPTDRHRRRWGRQWHQARHGEGPGTARPTRGEESASDAYPRLQRLGMAWPHGPDRRRARARNRQGATATGAHTYTHLDPVTCRRPTVPGFGLRWPLPAAPPCPAGPRAPAFLPLHHPPCPPRLLPCCRCTSGPPSPRPELRARVRYAAAGI